VVLANFKRLGFVIFTLSSLVLAFGQSPAVAFNLRGLDWRPSPLAQRLGRGESEAIGDEFIAAALSFSGLSEIKQASLSQKLQELKQGVLRLIRAQEPSPSLAEQVFLFLHKNYLKKYQLEATRLDLLLDKGLFNCVSSSVLYAYALEIAGFPYLGVKTKDHVFIKVLTKEGWFDVETTNPYGFNPASKKEFQDHLGAVTGFVYVPPSSGKERRDISRKELLALILNNRVAWAIQQAAYAEALQAAADIFELLHDQESLEILLNTVELLANFALKTHQFEEGLVILDEALARYGEFKQLLLTRTHFISDWLRYLIDIGAYANAREVLKLMFNEGKIALDDYQLILGYWYKKKLRDLASKEKRDLEKGLALIEEAKIELSAKDELSTIEAGFRYNYILALIDEGNYSQAFELLLHWQKDRLISFENYQRLLSYAFNKKTIVQAQAGLYPEALRTIAEGLTLLPREKTLLDNLAALATNYLSKLIAEQSFSQAFAFLKEKLIEEHLSLSLRTDLLLYCYQRQAEFLASSGQAEQALSLLGEGLKALGRRSELLRQFEVIAHNYMLIFYQQKDYSTAIEIIRKYLKLYPESSILTKDLKDLESLSKP